MNISANRQSLDMSKLSKERQFRDLSLQLAETRQQVNDLRAQLVATHGKDFTDVLEVPA